MVVGDFALELDTVVIGAGPGGYVAAIRASQMGQKVAIIEREYIGGVCLNVGCIPSKALISAGHKYQEALDSEIFGVTTEGVKLDFAKTQEWKNNGVVAKLTGGVKGLLKKNKVEVIEGEAFFVDEHTLRVINGDNAQTYSFNNAIVATGSRPIEIKGFKFGGRVIDSTGGLNLTEVPKKLVIVGGGVIGSELGGAYANLGAEVTILEGSPQILPTFEKDMVKLVEKEFDKKGIQIVTNAMAKEAVDNGDSVTVTYEVDGKAETVEADYVMVTVGRRPNTDELGLEVAGVEMTERGLVKVDNQGRTNVKSIFAIGDITPGAALAHKASYEAKIAAEAIAGKPVAIDYIGMPAVAFTDPELATVGYTEKEAKEAGLDVKVIKFPLAGNGRALSLNQTEGFVRLVTTKEGNVLVGAQVAGISASDIIAELGLAIEAGMNADDIALTIHSHPSLSEAAMDAAEIALGLPIHA
ncbi:dihydrolipoyl dehydrogenase [Vagococcus zengguangii]|uniref:Dihydrolipoyl dehydrogenase n=1 Tax=Vagococcus zengguangii TaxID=2571750 RepID=A0A4D7CU64_9ENTE|nr:dihydrolipoyl dehydrogenase [Vagococcus zengguangii]QCI86833.1 dihydrolipoyl dehydrogenase [Vagococcus zengguangii]TLG80439.1 dihydrolipoyl dehydrogenase [Vagococcus zengguangii]